MRKKSRRRNRRLLTALAALGGAAMLAGRGKRDASIAANEAKEAGFDVKKTIMDNMPKNIDKKITDVYQDPIMTGGKGVKQGFRTTSANVQRGKVAPPGLFSMGKVKFEKPVITVPKPKFKGSAQVMRERATAKADAKRNDMLRAIRGDVPVQQVDPIMEFDQSQDFGFGVQAKDGGRIVKGEKKAVRKKIKRIQIRGFGKARR